MTKNQNERVPVWSWRDAIRKSQMSTAAKCLCYSIANYLNDAGGYAYPTVDALMSDMTCSNSTVARCVKEAVDAGYLYVQRMRNDKGHVYGTHYHPRFPDGAVLAEPEAKPKISNRLQGITLNDKSAPRRKTLNDKSLIRDSERLNEDLMCLDDKSSRHNSPNKDPKNKIPLNPPSGDRRTDSSTEADKPKPQPSQPTQAQCSPAFEEAFATYPGSDKGLAGAKLKAWAAWREQGCEAESAGVLAGIRRYAEAMREEGKKGRTIRRMDGWLRERRWERGKPEQRAAEARPVKSIPATPDVSPEERAIVRERIRALARSRANAERVTW